MEFHFATSIEQPYRAVAATLAEGPLAWLPEVELAPGAYTSELGIGNGDGRISRRLLVTAGAAQPFAYGLLVPIEWRAAQHPERYPTLAGVLRLEPSGPVCRLRLDAHYVPPAGRLGAAVDRALLHNVAETSVKEFVQRVAARLARGARFSGPIPPATS